MSVWSHINVAETNTTFDTTFNNTRTQDDQRYIGVIIMDAAKIILDENEPPERWYNIQADLPIAAILQSISRLPEV